MAVCSIGGIDDKLPETLEVRLDPEIGFGTHDAVLMTRTVQLRPNIDVEASSVSWNSAGRVGASERNRRLLATRRECSRRPVGHVLTGVKLPAIRCSGRPVSYGCQGPDVNA